MHKNQDTLMIVASCVPLLALSVEFKVGILISLIIAVLYMIDSVLLVVPQVRRLEPEIKWMFFFYVHVAVIVGVRFLGSIYFPHTVTDLHVIFYLMLIPAMPFVMHTMLSDRSDTSVFFIICLILCFSLTAFLGQSRLVEQPLLWLCIVAYAFIIHKVITHVV